MSELKRQFNSALYERLVLSANKDKVARLATEGQMQMYVNYYDRKVKLADENPTIGIVLCKDKNNAVVEMTLPENNTQIFASKYQTVLPSKEELKRLLEEQNNGLD